jgi:three-Cys-motif partner protein
MLTGAGGTFCVGGDVKAMAARGNETTLTDDRIADLRGKMEAARLLHEMRKPTIAAIEGAAAGAGLSLALACDLRIANRSAKLTTAFAKVALSGDFGGTYFLTKLLGSAKARELYLLSPVLTAQEAFNLGMVSKVFPRADYSQYKRALCLLDPYNIDLTWEVIETAGKARSVEIFMNFMIMDVNRNALRKNPDKSIASKVAQMTRLWGDDSWLDAGYDQVQTLFDYSIPVKVSNERFAEAFRERLVKKAGFKFVPKPMPMKTKTNSVIYYLYFASQKEAGMDIVNYIFNKYRAKQGL